MIVNGKEILEAPEDYKRAAQIQTEINKVESLPAEIKRAVSKKEMEGVLDVIDGYNTSMFDDFEEDSGVATRREAIEVYREMSNVDVICKSLEIVSDNATQSNQEGNVLAVYSDDESIKARLDDLFINRLDLNNELWSIVLETSTIGDGFFEIQVDDLDKPKKVMGLKYLEPERTERVEINDKLAYFNYKMDGRKIKQKDIKEITFRLQPWQVAHFRLENRDSAPYGASVLRGGVRAYRRLILLEDISLVYRISRAPERRVFKVPVGQMNKVEAQNFLRKFKDNYRTQPVIDEHGKLTRRASVMSITQDIFIPVREGEQSVEITPLQGGSSILGGQDDLLKYLKDKIVRLMNIPPAYLGDESDRSRSCLHPTTLIELADGRVLSIEKISEEFKQGKVNYVFSIKNGEWVIKPIAWAGVTKTNTEVVKVKLDNGEEVICTPDHLFMLRNGEYKRANEMASGDSLMPLYSKFSTKNIKGYKQILNNKTGEWEYAHRVSIKDNLSALEEEEKKKMIVHHKDFNKLNNNPTNLVLMDKKEHLLYHASVVRKLSENKELVARRNESIRAYYSTEEGLEKARARQKLGVYSEKRLAWLSSDEHKELKREQIKKQREEGRIYMTPEGRRKLSEKSKAMWKDEKMRSVLLSICSLGGKALNKNNLIYKKLTKETILEAIFQVGTLEKDVCRYLNCSKSTIERTLKKYGCSTYREFLKGEGLPYKSNTIVIDFKLIRRLTQEGKRLKEIAKYFDCSVDTILSSIKKNGYESFTELRTQANNHKVVSVEKFGICEKVYDLTIDEETPNFALASGIVVHNSLAAVDVNFSKFTERIQSHIIKTLNKVASLDLYFAGYKKEALYNFSIELTPPSNIKEITELEFISQKMTLVQTMMSLNIFPLNYILKKVFRMTDKEVANIQLYKKLEAQMSQQDPAAGDVGGAGMDMGGGVPMTDMSGSGMDMSGGGGDVAAAELPTPEMPLPDSGVEGVPQENTLMNILGKEFLIENKKDFFKVLKFAEMNEKVMRDGVDSSSYLIEAISGYLMGEKKKKRTSQNISHLRTIGEFSGIDFKENTITYFTEEMVNENGSSFREKTISLNG